MVHSSQPLKKLDAVFFRTAMGNEPVREWLKALDKQNRQEVGQDIMTVQFGWPIGMPLVRHLGDGLWEIRSQLATGNIARVIFFMDNDCIVLVNGFIKKNQKTPKDELLLAKKRKSLFLTEGPSL